jgi:hypothetical protein
MPSLRSTSLPSRAPSRPLLTIHPTTSPLSLQTPPRGPGVCARARVCASQRGNEKHRRSGPADLLAIASIKAALHIPVLSNGNVSSFADALGALQLTRCDGVMSAEEILRDPALFERCDSAVARAAARTAPPTDDATHAETADALLSPVRLCDEYLKLCEAHPPSSVWQQGTGPCVVARHHLGRILQHLQGARDFLSTRECLGATTVADLSAAFRRHFGSQLTSRSTVEAGRARCSRYDAPMSAPDLSDEIDDDQECLMRLAQLRQAGSASGGRGRASA